MRQIIFLLSFILIRPIQLSAHNQLQKVEEQDNPYVMCISQIDTTQKENAIAAIDQNDDNGTQRMLTTFFDMLGDFVNILKDPNDSYHVALQIAHIVKTLVCLGVEEMSKGRIILDENDKEETTLSRYQLDQEYILALKNRFIAYAEQVKQIDMMK